mgnify:CR=1 FL=1
MVNGDLYGSTPVLIAVVLRGTNVTKMKELIRELMNAAGCGGPC